MKFYMVQTFVLGLISLAPVFAQEEDVSSSTEKDSMEESDFDQPETSFNQSVHRSHGSNYAAYQESCEPVNGKKCFTDRNMHCDNSTCECVANTTYSSPQQSCFEISTKQEQWACEVDTQCTQSSYGQLSSCNASKTCECYTASPEPVVLGKNDVCYLKRAYNEMCTSDEECKASIGEEAVCLGLKTAGICNCKTTHTWNQPLNECLEIGSFGSSCKINAQCQDTQGLGPHSRCNDASKCECWVEKEETGYFNTKCYKKRGANDTCNSREECVVGYHKDAVCLSHPAYRDEAVCQCPNGQTCENSGMRMSSGLAFLGVAVVWALNFVKF